MSEVPEFNMDHQGEFDEMFLHNASVHIERMNTRAFWIGIETADGRNIHVNTGVHNGKWFFNVEDTAVGGKFESVERPACHRKHARGRK